MPMTVQIGTYKAQPGNVSYRVSRDTLFTDGDTAYAELVRFDFRGTITGFGGAAMSVEIAKLQAAFANDGVDVVVLLPDGITHSEHVLISSLCVGGTHVVQRPSFPTNEGAIYSNRMPWTAAIQGEIPIPSVTSLLRWNEQVRFSGGGSRYGHLERQRGRPIPIRLREHTVFHVTQAGESIGYSAYPTEPLPLFPASLIANPIITSYSPKRRGQGKDRTFSHFRIRWTYEFESAFPLFGQPTPWSTN